MTAKPTAVVLSLPSSTEQAQKMYEAYCSAFARSSGTTRGSAITAAILAIGTPVAGGELEVEGYVRPDWREGWTTANRTDCGNILSDQKLETFSKALCDHDKAQSALADAQAEIVRLRETLEDAKTFHEEQDKAISKHPPSAQGQWRRHQHQEQIENIEEALKGPAA